MRGRIAALVVLVVLGCVGVPGVRAQNLEVTATVHPQKGRVGEEMLLTVVVHGASRNLSDPRLPPLDAMFDVFSAGTSRSVSIVNGKTTSSFTSRYRLMPRKAGTITIGSIEVEHDGSVHRTRPIIVEVEAGSPPPAPLPDDAAGSSTGGTRDLFVRATIDKKDPFLFEQITYRLLFYRRVSLIDDPSLTAPTTQGFWKEDLPSRRIFDEVVDGTVYRVSEVAFALFPTTPGDLTIGESSLECLVRVRRSNRDPFTMFGGSVFDGKRVILRTEPIAVTVRRLPPGAPEGFDGAVGDYVMETQVDKREINQDEPVTLRISVSGRGNLKTIGDIVLPDLPDFRAYPQADSRDVSTQGLALEGKYTRDFVLVPLSAGNKTIPPIRVVTFSPRTGGYRVLESRPIALSVTPGAGRQGSTGSSRTDIEVVGRDIRFIETQPPVFQSPDAVWKKVGGVLAFLPLPLLGYAGLWVVDRRRRRLGGDVGLRRRLRAAKTARRTLKDAAGVTDVADRAASAASAVRGYVADLWNVPSAAVTAELVGNRLGGQGLDPEGLVRLLDECDAARFAPAGAFAGGRDPVAEASDWIDRLEKSR